MYDGTVRNGGNGKLIQFLYGEDSMDGRWVRRRALRAMCRHCCCTSAHTSVIAMSPSPCLCASRSQIESQHIPFFSMSLDEFQRTYCWWSTSDDGRCVMLGFTEPSG
jgi:hypothetical protein